MFSHTIIHVHEKIALSKDLYKGHTVDMQPASYNIKGQGHRDNVTKA